MPAPNVPILKDRSDDDMWKLLRIQEVLREQDYEVPGQLVSVLYFIAAHNPCHTVAIAEGLGMTPNSVSRNTDWLSMQHRLGKPGLGLIYKKVDPTDTRLRICTLSPKGEVLVKRIKLILHDN
jgi:DNA-binding MarR family transcriptional regulator